MLAHSQCHQSGTSGDGEADSGRRGCGGGICLLIFFRQVSQILEEIESCGCDFSNSAQVNQRDCKNCKQ